MLKLTGILTISALAVLGSYTKKASPKTAYRQSTTIFNTNDSLAKSAADSITLKVGDKIPDIPLIDSAGNAVKLSDLKGKYVLIDVWASWCYPCRMQQPYLMALEERMENKNITFLGISIDTQIWRWKGPLLRKMKGTQWMVKDKTFEKMFGIDRIPRFILLDKKGNVLKLEMPLPSHPELEQELNKLPKI